MQYILLALVYFGHYFIIIMMIHVSRYREQKEVWLYGKSIYYLICIENLVRSWGDVIKFLLSRRWVEKPWAVSLGETLDVVKWFSDPWTYSQGEIIVENCYLVHWALVVGIEDFLSSLLLVTLGREVGQTKDCWAEKGHTSLGVKNVWGMRDYRLIASTSTLNWAIMLRIKP
jgi:hypothetical protein